MIGKLFSHWTEVPEWLWTKDFHPKVDTRLYTPDTGAFYYDALSMIYLQNMRNILGPLRINSGYRSPAYNDSLPGAAKGSYHKNLIAFDIAQRDYDLQDMTEAALQAGFTGIGLYEEDRFIHVDRGPRREWKG